MHGYSLRKQGKNTYHDVMSHKSIKYKPKAWKLLFVFLGNNYKDKLTLMWKVFV